MATPRTISQPLSSTDRALIDENMRRAQLGLPPVWSQKDNSSALRVVKPAPARQPRDWPVRPAPGTLRLLIRPASNMWRWVLYADNRIIAEGVPLGTEGGAVRDADWMINHVFSGANIGRAELKHEPSEVRVMSDQELTLRRKVGAVRDILAKARTQIARALPEHLTPERMMRIVETCAQRNPALMNATPRSLIGAVVEASQLGLEPDGKLGHAYLIPFQNRKTRCLEVTLIPGYKGLMDLAYRSGEVSTIRAAAVFEKDDYEYTEGLEPRLEHTPSRNKDRGDVVAAYAVAKMINGHSVHAWLWRAEIDKIREDSKAGKSGPWVDHFAEMAKKTAIRRLCKILPVSVVRRAAILQEQAESGQSQSFASNMDFLSADTIDISASPTDETPQEDDAPEPSAGADEPTDIITEAQSRLNAAKRAVDCDSVVKDVESLTDVSEEIKQRVAGLAARRKKELSGARRKAKEPPREEKAPEAGDDEPDPQLVASRKLRSTLLNQLEGSTTRKETAEIESEAFERQSVGDLLPADCEAVMSACRKRLKEQPKPD